MVGHLWPLTILLTKAKFSIYLDETIKGFALKSEFMDVNEFYANHNSIDI